MTDIQNSSQNRGRKRASKSCHRCLRRKQRCHGFPICTNCQAANQPCIQSDYARQLHRDSPQYAAFERIQYLERQLADTQAALLEARKNQSRPVHDPARHATASMSPSDQGSRYPGHFSNQHHKHGQDTANSTTGDSPYINSPSSDSENSQKPHLAEIVGFIVLGDNGGSDPAYVGSSSGFSIATHMTQMVQATVLTKALSSTVSEHQSQPLTLADLRGHSADIPNDHMGERILKAYFEKIHPRYPFLDRAEVFDLHAQRHQPPNSDPKKRFDALKLNMIYAIGATMLQLTGFYDYTPPEKFFMAALQYISAAREANSVRNIQTMILLVLYNLRSPSNSGVWYMIGLAMRTAIDLGLHREAHYSNTTPYQGQLRRRLFWSIYTLERVIAISLGRPFSIADQDIDTSIPLDIDDTICDDEAIASFASSPSNSNNTRTNMTMCISLVRLKRIESEIQYRIYRVDMPISSLFPEVAPLLASLENWEQSLPKLSESESDYIHLHWNKAIRLLLQPFLSTLEPSDELIGRCLTASGEICEIFKKMHQRDAYGHSFISVHTIFMAGVTMCYCLLLAPHLWSMPVSNALRACSSTLFVMADRVSGVKKYRDVLETVISSVMDYIGNSTAEKKSDSTQHRDDLPGRQGPLSSRDNTAAKSLLGLSMERGSFNILSAFGNPPRASDHTATSQRRSDDILRSSMNVNAVEPMIEACRPFAAYDESRPEEMTPWEQNPINCLQPIYMNSGQNLWEADRFSPQMLNEILMLDSCQGIPNRSPL